MNYLQPLATVCENPDAEDPRLAFADYIERDEPERAVFIRWSVAIKRQSMTLFRFSFSSEIEREAEPILGEFYQGTPHELFQQWLLRLDQSLHERLFLQESGYQTAVTQFVERSRQFGESRVNISWTPPPRPNWFSAIQEIYQQRLPEIPGWKWDDFTSGFIEAANVSNDEDLAVHFERAAHVTPLKMLSLSAVVDLQKLWQCKRLNQIERLELSQIQLPAGSVERLLAHTPYLDRLKSLSISLPSRGNEWISALSRWPRLKQLSHLRVWSTEPISAQVMQMLLDSPHRGEQLTIDKNDRVGPGAVLGLRGDYLGDWGLARVMQCAEVAKLPKLYLHNQHITDEGVEILLRSPYILQITWLDLERNMLTGLAANLLARAEVLRDLHMLELNTNRLGDEGALALALSPNLHRLEHLGLRNTQLTDRSALAFADPARLPSLKRLEINDNSLSDECKRQLRARFDVPGSREQWVVC